MHVDPKGTTLARHLCERLLSHTEHSGFPATMMLARAGLSPADDWPAVLNGLCLAQYDALAAAIVGTTGNPAIGVEAGLAATPGQLPMPLHFTFNSEPVQEVGGQTMLYFELARLADQFSMAMDTTTLVVAFRFDRGLPTLYRLLVEYIFASSKSLSVHALGRPLTLHQIRFQHAAGGPVREYRRAFRSPVFFNQPRNEIHICKSFLPPELLRDSRNTRLAATFDPARPEFVCQVVATIRRRLYLQKPVTAEYIASNLMISASSLQRKLKLLGYCYQSLLDEVRYAECLRLMEDSDLSIGLIARRLGFSGPGGLYRAWRRWTGQALSRDRIASQP